MKEFATNGIEIAIYRLNNMKKILTSIIKSQNKLKAEKSIEKYH